MQLRITVALLAGISPADSPQVAWSLEVLGLILKDCAAMSRLPSHLLESVVLSILVQDLTFTLAKFYCGYI